MGTIAKKQTQNVSANELVTELATWSSALEAASDSFAKGLRPSEFQREAQSHKLSTWRDIRQSKIFDTEDFNTRYLQAINLPALNDFYVPLIEDVASANTTLCNSFTTSVWSPTDIALFNTNWPSFKNHVTNAMVSLQKVESDDVKKVTAQLIDLTARFEERLQNNKANKGPSDADRLQTYLDTADAVRDEFRLLRSQVKELARGQEGRIEIIRQMLDPQSSVFDRTKANLQTKILSVESEADLDRLRVALLGKKGEISDVLRELGSIKVAPNSPELSQLNFLRAQTNALKDFGADALGRRKAELELIALNKRLETEREDLTLPSRAEPVGALHPVMQVFEELAAIFADMGFAVAEGPDIEDDFHNFTALNFPPGHPARETHDTFFMKPDASGAKKVLRTHTSPVQIRTMMTQKPPIRVIAPGRVFRKDWDATHTPMFHQIEGLVIDRQAHMGHLKSCLTEAFSRFFEVPTTQSRFRPHFFPFTEPSAEMDIRCDRSGGEIKVGEGNDWLEILGCGMVHPNVLKSCNIDPEEYQGFAFGLGVDRLAMLKYGMPDLRPYFEADVEWIKHYGFKPWLLPTVTGGLS